VEALRGLSLEKGISPAQLAIAWALSKGRTLVPVLGARTRTQLAEMLAALEVELSPAEAAQIEAKIPASAVAGARYDENHMRMLDSEK
jgi:aryl-alcohol dehydrogenase-like predicted oxidoreductase